jgi:glycosyltransferase involved in cell wall biosynthesis
MVSLIVPIYNDGYLAKDFFDRYQTVFTSSENAEFFKDQIELIFVNDGSIDDSIKYLLKISSAHSFVKIIDLSKNFGQHIAITAGYEIAKGDYIGMMNVDLQEDVDEFLKLVVFLKNNQNFDFVIGLREKRDDRIINKISSFLFNKTLNFLTGDITPVNSSTVRVMTRYFLNAYLQLYEKDRYLPALENWLGFNKAYLPIKYQERKKGKSSYNFYRRLKMAINAIVTFSDKPIRVAAAFGLLVTFIGFLLGMRLVILKLFYSNVPPGYTSTVTLIILFSGLQLLFLGLTAIYIGKILKEVQNRPLYIIKGKYNV